MTNLLKNPWFLMSAVLILILGFSVFASGGNGPTQPVQTQNSSALRGELKPVSGVEVSPQPFEFGEVSMKKGIVTKTFDIKNKSGQKIEVSKIETSCMCTEASFKAEGRESPYFGMPGHTFNGGWQASVPDKGSASLTVRFDPAAHGPSGVGLAKRVVRVFLNDPQNTYLDINFTADVTN